MKSTFILFQFFILQIGFLLSQSDYLQKQANDFFIKQIRQAHPEPELNLNNLYFLIPVQPLNKGFSNFLNVCLTVNETEQYKMQNESSIAINPLNKNNLIASAVDYRDTSATWVYVSQDAGKTWVNHNLKRPFKGWTASNDPSVAFSNDGTGYLVVGGFGERSNGSTQAQIVENGIFLCRTTDNGNSWQSHIPVIVHRGTQTIDSTFEDKYYIWSDNSTASPYNGHLYIPWKRVWAKDSATQIVISKSTDKGSTWSSPIPASPRLPRSSEDTTYGQSFPISVTGPDGEVYVVWNNGIEHAVGFACSTDGGKTFSAPGLIQHYNIFGITTEIEKNVWRHALKGKVRAETYPSLVADISNSPRRGWLYLTWAADNVPNIYFSRSTDKGKTWSPPVIVHSDTTNDQFWQWIALDKTNGDLAVMYLDSRDDSQNLLNSTYVSYSSDGGTTWIDRRAADFSGDLRKNPFTNNSFAGDYSGCAFSDGKVYPSWIDMRAAETDIFDSDVYSAIVDINAPSAPENFDARTIPENPDEILLSWNQVNKKSFGQALIADSLKYIVKRNDSVIAKLNSNIVTYIDKGLEKFKMYKYSVEAEYNSLLSGKRIDSAWAGGSKEPGIPVISSIKRSQKELTISVKIPSKRLDGSTPFINPSTLVVYCINAKRLVIKNDLKLSDTSTTVTIFDQTKENGYFNYVAFITDSYGNSSPSSDTVMVYAGDYLSSYEDDFNDAVLRKYIDHYGWGLSSEFSRSGNSLTDSPNGDYLPLTDNYIVLFPYENQESVNFSFWHAAFVQPRDSAIVEYSDDGRNTWKMLAYFDKDMYEPWKDGIKSSDDWKFEKFTISSVKAPVYFRFRLKTNALKNDDGWYIDDVSFSPYQAVNDVSVTKDFLIYPNPADKFINLNLNHNDLITSYQIFNLYGVMVADGSDVNFNSSNGIINISQFIPGFYSIVIKCTDFRQAAGRFIKK